MEWALYFPILAMTAHSSSQIPESQGGGPLEGQRLLLELGRRLRARRLELGLSLSALAEAAGVSRRHLTEAEAGRANPSVLTLAAVARALALPLAELIHEPGPPRERIALVGLRGAGKSTLGRALALELEVPFVELDQRVEELSGLSLGEVFDLHGAEGYHRFEAQALEAVLAEGERMVLAVGGSLPTRPATFERLLATCRTIWLRAAPSEHFERVLAQGDRRPMADRPRARAELEALLAARAPLYARCHAQLDTGGRSEDAARAALVTLVARAGPERP
jgi:XRE family aerobic/anaerobic benzoate catabolism transcriptional regulator